MPIKAESLIKSILVIGWYFISALCVKWLLMIVAGVDFSDQTYIEGHRYAITLCNQALCLIGLVIVSNDYNNEERIKKRIRLKTIGRYILMGVGAWLICVLINALLGAFFHDYAKINELFNEKEPIRRFLAIVIGAPLLEEIVFRNKLQGYIKQGFGLPCAVIIQAFIFGSFHALALQKIYATSVGILFGVIREREKNAESTIIMHMTVNFIGWSIGSFFN